MTVPDLPVPRTQPAAPSDRHVRVRTIETLPALERDSRVGLGAWGALVASDPLASLFQSPGWCLSWYRSYHDEFDPFVIVVMDGSTLVGVVPLAVHRATHEIRFAGGTMADYRDIVAAPGYRQAVVDALLRTYLEGRFANPLSIGWLDPASDTAALVAKACRDLDVRFISWQQPCYRWTPRAGENLNKKFSRLRPHMNYFKRVGNLAFEVVSGPEEWPAFRDRFFEQHSLRQLQADRPLVFDDPRKREFYDRVFESPEVQTHVTAMRLDDELLAGHVGFVWRDVLMLGAPSIAIEHETRSPALILLSWIMQHAPELGLEGFDLTIGNTEFKRRLGNSCVKVTAIELFGRRSAYYLRTARREATAIAKGVAAAALGRDAWETHVRPAVHRVVEHAAAARTHGLGSALLEALKGGGGADRSSAERVLRPEDLQSIADTPANRSWQIHQNCVSDLLKWDRSDAHATRAVRQCARAYARKRSAGATFHTVSADGQLMAWCFSRLSDGDGVLTIENVEASRNGRRLGADRALLAMVAHAGFASDATRVVVRGE